MSDKGPHEPKCNDHHEHNRDRVFLELTPSGLKLNVLGLVGELYALLKVEDYEAAVELVDVTGQLLSAAYTGNFKLLDGAYENALVLRLSEELDKPDVLAELDKERGSE